MANANPSLNLNTNGLRTNMTRMRKEVIAEDFPTVFTNCPEKYIYVISDGIQTSQVFPLAKAAEAGLVKYETGAFAQLGQYYSIKIGLRNSRVRLVLEK